MMRKKHEHTTTVWQNCGWRNSYFNFCFSIWRSVHAGRNAGEL